MEPCDLTPHDPRTPAYWREHLQIDAMPIGGKPLKVRNGRLARVRHNEYCLHHDYERSRARWGTAAEIAEDLAHLEAFGRLPKANGGIW